MKKTILTIATIIMIAGLNSLYAGNGAECEYSAKKAKLTTAQGDVQVIKAEYDKSKVAAGEGDCCDVLLGKYKATLASAETTENAEVKTAECDSTAKAINTKLAAGECEYSLKNVKLAADSSQCAKGEAKAQPVLAQNNPEIDAENKVSASN